MYPILTQGDPTTPPKKKIVDYQPLYSHGQSTEIISPFHPDNIEVALEQYLATQYGENIQKNPKKYKMEFTLPTYDIEHQKECTRICVRILKVDEESVCIEFTHLAGSKHNFNQHYTQMVEMFDQKVEAEE